MPEPRVRLARISADLDTRTLAQLEERSRQEGSTVAMLVRQILEKYFETDPRLSARPRVGVAAKEKPVETGDIREVRGMLKAQSRGGVSLENMDEAMGRLLADEDRRVRNEAAS